MQVLHVVVPTITISEAVEVARTVADHDGELSRNQVAAKLGFKIGTGNANMKVLSAQLYGLIDRRKNERYSVTDLGRRSLLPAESGKAMREAIEKVHAFRNALAQIESQADDADADAIDRVLLAAGIKPELVQNKRRLLLRSLVAIDETIKSGMQDLPSSRPYVRLRPKSARPNPSNAVTVEKKPAVRTDGEQIAVSTTQVSERATTLADLPVMISLIEAAPPLEEACSDEKLADWISAVHSALRYVYKR